jgi:hypothetical protein
MMNKIYHSESLRATIGKGKIWRNTTLIQIQVQRKWLFLAFWETVDKVNIEIKEFWTIPAEIVGIPGYDATNRPLRMGNSYGDRMEVWYPNKFNIKKRVAEMFEEYIKMHSGEVRSKNDLKRQLNAL